uniref:Uncharacterized protein n=1 Tax=Psilocybe cubensis TaxID=181762 RepID=A0A8H7XIC9_PSICU
MSEKDLSFKPRPTPRFSSDTVGQGQTAKKHSFSMPARMGHENSDGPERFIPGAFPTDNSPAPNRRQGVRVGTGMMLNDPDEVDRTQLPTSEEPSLSRVGVGSLPGGIKEPGVAILPEERLHPDPYLRGYTALDASSLQKGIQRNRTYELPTTEEPSGSRVGIGSMPGTIHEGGVATLPEERIDGRPYGSGHTGFEKTLGKGHTVRQVHPVHGTKPKKKHSIGSKPKQAPQHAKSPPKSNAKIIVDDQARQALHEQNPIRPSPSKSNTFPSDERTLPGDTIFSATQRARAHDPNFIHGSGGKPASRPIEEPATTTDDQRKKVSQNLATQGSQGLGNAAHVGSSMLQSVEGAAIGALHGAEHVFHNIESSARAYFPDVSKQGAENMLHSLESGAKAHMPSVPSYFRGGNVRAAKNTSQGQHSTPSGGVGGPMNATGSGSFTTSGADAPHSKAKDFAMPDSQPNQHGGTDASETIIHRPRGVEAEYFRIGEFDIYGERLDTDQFVYEDDITTEEGDSIRSRNSEHFFAKADADRDRASDRARGSYAPGDGSKRQGDSPEVLYGYGGVGYYKQGGEGILPGYPTPEGMNKLISDRLKDDHLRATAGSNSAKEKFNTAKSEAVQGPISEGISVDTEHYDDEIKLVKRDPEELKEIPVFEGGASSASGKFEAVFEAAPDEYKTPTDLGSKGSSPYPLEAKEVPVFKSGEPTAVGKYEAVFQPATTGRRVEGPKLAKEEVKWKEYQTSKNVAPTGGLKVGYLGKPVSEEEKALELEQARQAAVRKMGID